MATSSFAKNFILNPNEMTKECKEHLFDENFNTQKPKTNFRSHVASEEDVNKLIRRISK